jgi:spore germination protein GerM
VKLISRPMGWRLAALVAGGLALTAAACSSPVDSGPKTLRAASIPEALRSSSSTTSTTIPSGPSEEVTVYYIQRDGRLAPVKRRVAPPVTVEKILQTLFAGPSDAEAVAGLRSQINPGTSVLGAPIEARIATVNVSKNFAFGDPLDQILAVAQVVFTAVEIEGVAGVLFAENGQRLEVPSGDGSATSAPLSRAAFSGATPR